MSFRKEKKFRLSFSELNFMKKNLFQSGMTSLYPARIVNSCYFDTHDLKLFSESEEGVLPRKKFEFDGIIIKIILLEKLRFLP